MTWMFKGFLVDKERAEITGPEGPVHIERLPFDLLALLIENRDRVITRSELIDKIWGGRIISDATISTAVKQARKAIGDDGNTQAVIKTVHGRGFRFVADLSEPNNTTLTEASSADVSPIGDAHLAESVGAGRPSIAALRFQMIKSDQSAAWLLSAIPSELLSSLSRMRWLHVVSRGSSFQFDPEAFVPSDIGAKLSVRYLISGTVEIIDQTAVISVELTLTNSGQVLWCDHFSADLQDIQQTRHTIIASIIAALELELPRYEASQSRRLKPNELDAWSHFHLGLSHIYKYREDHNQTAAQHFDQALALDPNFARAHAGRSFTHWQTAFMRFGSDRDRLTELAITSARNALDLDPLDPFSNFNMGRGRWLKGDVEGSAIWIDRALQLNPNHAHSHYNKGLMQLLEGMPEAATSSAAQAISLSPLDPIGYAMLCVQVLSKIALEDFEGAGRLADQALQSPGAHFYISLIGACAKELQGDHAAALSYAEQAQRQRPDATTSMFLMAFPFRENRMRKIMSDALGRLGVI